MNMRDLEELDDMRRRIEHLQRLRLVDRDPEEQRRDEESLQRLQHRYAARRAELA